MNMLAVRHPSRVYTHDEVDALRAMVSAEVLHGWRRYYTVEIDGQVSVTEGTVEFVMGDTAVLARRGRVLTASETLAEINRREPVLVAAWN